MIVELSKLGDRICVMGPSNSGKSMLADAIARKKQIQAVHLDRLFHLPGTDWIPRPFAEFTKLHDAIIEAQAWIIDGNYSQLLPQRLARATGFILLDVSTPLSLLRYIRRSLDRRDRSGSLEGGKDSVKWRMLRHITTTTLANRRRYTKLLETIEVPKVHLSSARQIDACYIKWELKC